MSLKMWWLLTKSEFEKDNLAQWHTGCVCDYLLSTDFKVNNNVVWQTFPACVLVGTKLKRHHGNVITTWGCQFITTWDYSSHPQTMKLIQYAVSNSIFLMTEYWPSAHGGSSSESSADNFPPPPSRMQNKEKKIKGYLRCFIVYHIKESVSLWPRMNDMFDSLHHCNHRHLSVCLVDCYEKEA